MRGVRTVLCAAACGLIVTAMWSGCRSAKDARGHGPAGAFGVMSPRVQVVLRLECSLGRVIFLAAGKQQVEPLKCQSDAHVYHFTVPPGRYTLSFRDALGERVWRTWVFSAETGVVNYWGDIHILPRLARVWVNRETMRVAQGLAAAPVRCTVHQRQRRRPAGRRASLRPRSGQP